MHNLLDDTLRNMKTASQAQGEEWYQNSAVAIHTTFCPKDIIGRALWMELRSNSLHSQFVM
jgi:hypothetical protein